MAITLNGAFPSPAHTINLGDNTHLENITSVTIGLTVDITTMGSTACSQWNSSGSTDIWLASLIDNGDNTADMRLVWKNASNTLTGSVSDAYSVTAGDVARMIWRWTSGSQAVFFVNGEKKTGTTAFGNPLAASAWDDLASPADMRVGARDNAALSGDYNDFFICKNTALTDDQCIAITTGASPLLVANSSLTRYYRFSTTSDLTCLISGNTGTLPNGSDGTGESELSTVAEPWAINYFTAAPPAGSTPVYLFHNRHHNRSA